MKFKQLGNGGAFNFEETNSSFLISLSEKNYLLFDCGYSVYTELRKQDRDEEIDLDNLNHVFISHMDDDHIGSLKTLILFMFFAKKKILNIYCPKEIYSPLKVFLSDIVGVMKDYKVIPTKMYDLKCLKNGEIEGVYIETIEAFHNKDCAGLYFNFKDSLNLYITGDTVAHNSIELMLNRKNEKTLIFHDFSYWNEPESQVHACQDNIKSNYSKELLETLNHYHNDDIYSKKWIKLEEKEILENNLKIYTPLDSDF